jgi:cytosine/adenosine deaminase-related metal-dependent hydrolase
MDYKPYTPFSDANIDGHMLFGMTGRQCQTTMINGKLLMRDRELVDIDEEPSTPHSGERQENSGAPSTTASIKRI